MAPAPRDGGKGGKDKPEEPREKRSLRPDTQIPEEHPQRLFLLSTVKPAVSLEAWFDAGLRRPARPLPGDDEEAEKPDDERHLTGVLRLPPGYSGVNKDQLLAIAVQPGIQVWPVRFELGDLHSDTEKPWTLYHYTHRESFEDLVKAFLDVQDKLHKLADFEQVQLITQVLLKELNDDYEERNPKPNPMNPRGDPEMMLVEPGKFASTEEAIKAMYGRQGLSRRTRGGTTFELMADYVVSFRVPGSACFPVPSASREGGVGAVRLCRDTLEMLRKRGDHRRESAKTEAKAARGKLKDPKKGKSGMGGRGWLSCLGVGKQPDLEDDVGEQRRARQDTQAKFSDQCILRDKRYLEQAQQISRNFWLRGHFENLQRKLEDEKKKEAEEQRKIDEKSAKRLAREAAIEASQEDTNAVVMNRGPNHGKKKKKAEVERGLDHYAKLVMGEGKYDGLVEATSRRKKEWSQTLYEDFRRREEEEGKEILKPALARIKLGKEGADMYFEARQQQMGATDSSQF